MMINKIPKTISYRIFGILSLKNIFFFILLSFFFLLGSLFFFFYHYPIDLSLLAYCQEGKPSVVLDDQGNELARFSIDKREKVSYEAFPSFLIQAFVAAEDHDFFTHHGISAKGILRSLLVNFYYGYYAQGASTITQQLVKLLFFDGRKTLIRKFKEQVMALLVESSFTKEQIMESYLNNVCFGSGIYGVEAASQRFWGKKVSEITKEEAALLASIVRSPRDYNPLVYPLSAQKRRNMVLNSMAQMGFIDNQEAVGLKKMPLVLKESQEQCAPHVKEMIRLKVEEIVGKDALYRGGFTIQSTINNDMQRCAQEMFKKELVQLRAKHSNAPIDGGLLCIEVKTGEIKALVGGFDFKRSQFNRALQARRQLGSLFKPLIYAVAIEQGMNFAQTEIDEPIDIKQTKSDVWRPHNASLKYEGEMTLAKALSHSNNIIAIKTLLKVGYESVIRLAHQCGITAHLDPYPSLALGCIDVSLKQAAAMFNVFANNGDYVEPYGIKWIKDEFSVKIWKNQYLSYNVLDPLVNGQVAKVLAISLERAKNKFPHSWLESEALGKSGTSNDFETSWFIGSTPTFTTAIYIGCDDNSSLGKNMYGSTTAFPLWLSFNRAIVHDRKKFIFDSRLKEIFIDSVTGLPTSATHSKALRIFVKK